MLSRRGRRGHPARAVRSLRRRPGRAVLKRAPRRSSATDLSEPLLRAAHVWQFFFADVSPSALRRRCLSWLAEQERRRYEAFRTGQARHEYLATRALCRATLSRYAGLNPAAWTFATGRYGKPRVAGPARFRSLRFSLSHAGGLVVCLISRAGEVGVDVEDTSRPVDLAQVARHFMTRKEQAHLAALPARRRVKRFFAQWVAREAYLKGLGKGVASGPERFTVKFDDAGAPLSIGRWRLFLNRPTPVHVAAVALRPRRGLAGVSINWLKTDL